MRERYREIREAGGEVVAIGTGDRSHAQAFASDEQIPYPVLVDDDARAAKAADVPRVGLTKLFHPASYAGTARAFRSGHRIGRPGKRPDQLGASFVIGPTAAGSELRFAHWDAHSADHAPIAEILAALRAPARAAAKR